MWPHNVNFVIDNYEPFRVLNDDQGFPDDLTPYFEQCLALEDLWITQTFIYFKAAGYPVRLTNELVPKEICFVESSSLKSRRRVYKSYIVGCRADRAPSFLANQCTVMNKLSVKNSSHHHFYSWPQPVITKRNTRRGTSVKIVDFKGNQRNLWEPFQSAEFQKKIEGMGLKLKVSSEKGLSGVDLYRSWGDYSETDILLAVRNLTDYDLTIKPEIKLTNAWRAGVPAILGPEPAFQAIRKSDLDYIEVKSVDEAVKAIKKLQTEPLLYQKMVQNGFQRAKEFSKDKLLQQWIDLIEGPVFEDYEKWLSRGKIHTNVYSPFRSLIMSVRERYEINRHLKKVRHGKRPLN